jgi:protein-disulfide isomerase
MDDYFASVQAQLSGLCERRAHRRRRLRLRLPRAASLRGHSSSAAIIAASALVAAAVFVFAISSLSGGYRTQQPIGGNAGQSPPGLAQTGAPFAGIPQSGTVLGNPKAAVTITFFGDLECPSCARFVDGQVFSRLLGRVRAGTVRLVYRSLCTSTCALHDKQFFTTQQAAAYAAGEQNRFWDYSLAFYEHQGVVGTRYVTNAFLTAMARRLPTLNLARWQRDRGSPALARQVRHDAVAAEAARVYATPTLIVTGSGRPQTLIGLPTYARLSHAITEAGTMPSVNAIIQDCLKHGRLTEAYTARELRRAQATMPASVKQYTNCPSVLEDALATARP